MTQLESVDNALRLLLMLGRGNMKVTEAARQLDVAPSTAHRLLGTLVHRGFARQLEDRSYELGPVVQGLRPSVNGDSLLTQVSRTHLRRLAQVTGETSHVAVRDGHEIRFKASVESQQPLRIGARTGQVMPAHLTAAGKCLLADLTLPELVAVYGTPPVIGSEPFTTLHRELADVRRLGYAINRGRSERGLCAVAVPITGADLRPLAAVTVSVPSVRYRSSRVAGLVAALRDAAAGIVEELSEQTSPRALDGSYRRGMAAKQNPKNDGPGPSVKDPELYEALREDGASKEKAARIANAAAATSREEVGQRGGDAGSYDDRTVEELRRRAAELDIEGRSSMTKDELIDALRNH